MTAPAVAVRRGVRPWLAGYGRMVRWDLVSLRLHLPILGSVLVLEGAGFVLGIGLFFRHTPAATATFVATGAPVAELLTTGLIFDPQIVADQRADNSFDFLQCLPVPRGAMVMARFTVSVLVAVPSVVVTLAVAVARYGIALPLSPAVVPAGLAAALLGVLMGHMVAQGIPSPMVVRVVAVSCIFVVFGFSPVMFPAEQLPAWLADVNRWLPFGSLATVMRASLTTGYAHQVARSYAVVGVWTVVAAGATAWVAGRRR